MFCSENKLKKLLRLRIVPYLLLFALRLRLVRPLNFNRECIQVFKSAVMEINNCIRQCHNKYRTLLDLHAGGYV